MTYYTNNETGEVMATLGMMTLISPANNNHIVIFKCVFPNVPVGNGVEYHCIRYSDIVKHYTRVSKKKATQLHNDIGQLRHYSDKTIEESKLPDVLKRKIKYGI